jgi:stage IV sporulation protein FB
MKFRNGYLTLGHFGGAPIRIHWSTPVGAFILCGFSFSPGGWLGFLILVLVHELGHAVLARALGCHVVSIDTHAIGGVCAYTGDVTSRQAAIIAWGGVLAQAAVLVTAPLWSKLLPSWGFAAQLTSVLTTTNLIMIALNLLPVRPFDGADAWRLFRR